MPPATCSWLNQRGGDDRLTGQDQCAPDCSDRPCFSGAYWLRMLIAGILGTVTGDGIAHVFSSVMVGVPLSAGLATLALSLISSISTAVARKSGLVYWLAIICVRWWGTNMGDILKFLITLPLSVMASAVAMALFLSVWRVPEGRVR
jgi:uncharacterized membrane-anchored protein